MSAAAELDDCVACAVDQLLGDLGGPVWTEAAFNALRTGASLLAACVVRSRDGYVVHVSPLLEVQRSGDLQADIQRLTQHVMSALEGFIRQHPDEYLDLVVPEAADQARRPYLRRLNRSEGESR